jgi:hypothetical protein
LNPTLRTAFFLALAIAVVNGFARFAYALILPVMRSDLQWDYALSGWLNTANSLGYGVGGLTGMLLLARYRPSALFVTGLISSVITLLLVGFTTNFPFMLFLRFLTGIGSAWVFSCGGAMVATLYDKDAKQAGSAVAIYYAGGGLGIALSGFVIYPVLSGRYELVCCMGYFGHGRGNTGRASGCIGVKNPAETEFTFDTKIPLAIVYTSHARLCFIWRWLHCVHDICDRLVKRNAGECILFCNVMGSGGHWRNGFGMGVAKSDVELVANSYLCAFDARHCRGQCPATNFKI